MTEKPTVRQTLLQALFEDLQADATAREIAYQTYRAALAEGQTEDAALDNAAAALKRWRASWEQAKKEDEGGDS